MDLPALGNFALQCDSIAHVFSLISSIATGKKDQYALVSANSKGLRVSVENASKSCFASSYLHKELFTHFDIALVRGEHTEIRFRVGLAALLDCLNMFGLPAQPVTTLSLAYSEEDSKLFMLLEEAGVTAECTVTTVDAGEEADYDAAFRLHPVVCKTVMLSDVLHDAVRELCEQPGATSVVFTMSPQEPHFRLHTYGSAGAVTIDIRSSSDAFLTFDAAKEVTNTFHLKLLENNLRALNLATQSFLRINEAGMLSMAHKIVTEGGGQLFVSFTFQPDEAIDDELPGQQQQKHTDPELGADAAGNYAASGGDAAADGPEPE